MLIITQVFIEMLHRAPRSTGWENLLLDLLFTSPLPNQPKNLATQLGQLSASLEDLSTNFISFAARRCIINIYQFADDGMKDDSSVGLYLCVLILMADEM